MSDEDLVEMKNPQGDVRHFTEDEAETYSKYRDFERVDDSSSDGSDSGSSSDGGASADEKSSTSEKKVGESFKNWKSSLTKGRREAIKKADVTLEERYLEQQRKEEAAAAREAEKQAKEIQETQEKVRKQKAGKYQYTIDGEKVSKEEYLNRLEQQERSIEKGAINLRSNVSARAETRKKIKKYREKGYDVSFGKKETIETDLGEGTIKLSKTGGLQQGKPRPTPTFGHQTQSYTVPVDKTKEKPKISQAVRERWAKMTEAERAEARVRFQTTGGLDAWTTSLSSIIKPYEEFKRSIFTGDILKKGGSKDIKSELDKDWARETQEFMTEEAKKEGIEEKAVFYGKGFVGGPIGGPLTGLATGYLGGSAIQQIGVSYGPQAAAGAGKAAFAMGALTSTPEVAKAGIEIKKGQVERGTARLTRLGAFWASAGAGSKMVSKPTVETITKAKTPPQSKSLTGEYTQSAQLQKIKIHGPLSKLTGGRVGVGERLIISSSIGKPVKIAGTDVQFQSGSGSSEITMPTGKTITRKPFSYLSSQAPGSRDVAAFVSGAGIPTRFSWQKTPPMEVNMQVGTPQASKYEGTDIVRTKTSSTIKKTIPGRAGYHSGTYKLQETGISHQMKGITSDSGQIYTGGSRYTLKRGTRGGIIKEGAYSTTGYSKKIPGADSFTGQGQSFPAMGRSITTGQGVPLITTAGRSQPAIKLKPSARGVKYIEKGQFASKSKIPQTRNLVKGRGNYQFRMIKTGKHGLGKTSLGISGTKGSTTSGNNKLGFDMSGKELAWLHGYSTTSKMLSKWGAVGKNIYTPTSPQSGGTTAGKSSLVAATLDLKQAESGKTKTRSKPKTISQKIDVPKTRKKAGKQKKIKMDFKGIVKPSSKTHVISKGKFKTGLTQLSGTKQKPKQKTGTLLKPITDQEKIQSIGTIQEQGQKQEQIGGLVQTNLQKSKTSLIPPFGKGRHPAGSFVGGFTKKPWLPIAPPKLPPLGRSKKTKTQSDFSPSAPTSQYKPSLIGLSSSKTKASTKFNIPSGFGVRLPKTKKKKKGEKGQFKFGWKMNI